MFSVLLKAKLDVESKIEGLQRNYISLLRQPVLPIEFKSQNNLDAAVSIINTKIQTLEEIEEEYEKIYSLHQKLLLEIPEAKNDAESLEKLVDDLFSDSNIEIPEELQKSQEFIKSEIKVENLKEEEEENYQNHEEEQINSDKENSNIVELSDLNTSNESFFSPDVQMKPIPSTTRFNEVIRILGCNPSPMTLQGTNSYLIGKGIKRLLIDSSDPKKPDYIKALETILKEENALISNIISTHWHNDHLGSIVDVKKKELVTDDCKFWKFPRSDATEDYGELKFQELTDRQEFDIDGVKIKALHTPGHTTDHVVLFNEKTKALFSGDCILGEGTAIFEDLHDYMKSLELLSKLNISVIYPGHGDIIDSSPTKKIQFYINHRNEREKQILDAIITSSKPLTDMDIVAIAYVTTPKHLWPAAAVNVNQHLIKLKKEGKIIDVLKDHETYWQIIELNKL
ncbi:CLUMA_CG012665, isoform A [Clunio marinus]|uniref:Beta-lactamase-like protein 2 homolog n=1 Tax=Clunio marinus TaxID=568069 RepID=A0A1J1IGT9_9DIPT|nr:CLUMA_CG012665, isoform A [Clunio marinus]